MVIAGPAIDRRNWLIRFRDWLMNRKHQPLHREKFAYFYTDTVKGLLIGQMIAIAACKVGFDATWVITHIDEDGFNAKLTCGIPLHDLEKFNKITKASAIVIANTMKESNV